jgi:hypothetical protein
MAVRLEKIAGQNDRGYLRGVFAFAESASNGGVKVCVCVEFVRGHGCASVGQS